MPTGTAPRRRLLRLLALLGLLLVAGAAFRPAAAKADQIAEKRAEAARVSNELQQFDMRLEAAVQAYDGARVHLAAVEHQIAENRRRLQLARRNLRAAQNDLARLLVNSYKGGGQDVTAYVLASRSFNDLVDRVDFVDRMSTSEGDLLARIARTKAEIARRQAQLERDEAKAQKLVAQTRSRREQIQHGIAQRKAMLASIQSDIKRLIREAELRRERLARERAARAARERAQREAAARAAAQARAAAEAQAQAQAAEQPQQSSTSSSSSSDSESQPSPPPPSGSLGQQAAQIAQRYLGVPYVWGGASPSGFDCSGLVMYVYAQLGVSLPHYTVSQYNSGPHVPRDALEPGDLVFFYNLDHVGIYLGGGSFIHAPHTGDVVKISSLDDPWYSAAYAGATRVG